MTATEQQLLAGSADPDIGAHLAAGAAADHHRQRPDPNRPARTIEGKYQQQK
jgi:hypothetical protein